MNGTGSKQGEQENPELMARMSSIRHTVLVLSGKGGVGKSTVAANLAVSLAADGHKVGLLDVDIHGPSIPQLLGVNDQLVQLPGAGTDGKPLLCPIQVNENLVLMSMGALLDDPNTAVIWRGPRKYNAIKQFLEDVEWGELDYLIVDSPPGTGDEPLSVVQLIGQPTGAVVVTTPQDLAVSDVRRCVTFCRQLNLPVLGIVENMGSTVCPHCGENVPVFGHGGGEKLAQEMSVPFLGSIPFEPEMVSAGDNGVSWVKSSPDTEAGKCLQDICRKVVNTIDGESVNTKEKTMIKIAVPLVQGMLSAHFGHCEEFALLSCDPDTREIKCKDMCSAPVHEPGLLPRWLAEKGATLIVAGGMGQRAQSLFVQNGIEVLVGAPVAEAEVLAQAYLDGTLQTGTNVCDH